MTQLTVGSQPDQVYDGKVDDSIRFPTVTVVGIAGEVVYPGKGLASAVTDVGVPPTVFGYGSPTNVNLQGIAIADPSLEAVSGQNFQQYEVDAAVSMVRKGRIWVRTFNSSVTTLAASVFVRALSPILPPNGALGSWATEPLLNFIDISGLTPTPIRWVGGVTQNGVNFGLLEINLP